MKSLSGQPALAEAEPTLNDAAGQTEPTAESATLSAGRVFFLALACCLTLANMYAAQPIISEIAQTMGISVANSGIAITLAQIGYCAGVLLLVPLGDALENRRLITLLFISAALALLIISQAAIKSILLPAFLLLGLSSSLVQIIIPYSANLIKPAQRGRMIGFIVSGAAFGIVLGRPVSSTMTDIWGWQTMFFISSLLLIAVGVAFRFFLPARTPAPIKLSYASILRSMVKLFITMPVLRRQILLMILIFTGFTLFWATAPMVLQNELAFSHSQVALFSLASLTAPFCVIAGGVLADKGFRFAVIGIGIACSLGAFLISPIFGISGAALIFSILFLDSGVNTANVLIQQSVLMTLPEARSRLNALCISLTFMGGAAGSFLGPWLYNSYGWHATSVIGGCLSFVALAVYIRLKLTGNQFKN